MSLKRKCWADAVFSLKSHFFKNLKYHTFWGPSINSAELIKTTFSQKQLIEVLWDFIQSFGFLRRQKGYSQEKILFLEKAWNILKSRVFRAGKNLFFRTGKKFVPLMRYFLVYMMRHSCLYDSAKTTCIGKISFSSYTRKCSQPNRLQNFLSYFLNYLSYKVPFWM